MTDAAIIVAAGRGTRAGGDIPKQWQPLAGRRVADWTIDAIRAAGLSPVVIVLHPEELDAPGLPADLIRVAGGATRDASVRAGLAALDPDRVENVLIHDVARPCVPVAVIEGVRRALQTAEAAAPGLPVTDALWVGADGAVAGIQPRDGLFRAQTPQGFRLAPLLAAHAAHPGGAADDVEVARHAGLSVTITPGHEDNLKITHPGDFTRAEKILRGQMDIRMGNGFDVHAFEEGDHVWLCGVKVAHDKALKGHSDADVGMHAVTDAIYGALAEGDIGRHFPPSDPQWKGAASHIFLRHAVQLAAEKGFRISNVDCTLICERPKIGPHAAAMQQVMAEIMGMEVARVSVKATTSERLGFTGREEGIAAIATAVLIA
ncbi:bifunctional 2-C-methyl-D-erythritol 4-phosphate cytidylyltransferase/2-C-methyl-D-erythritol 2,4-cyclodiphosphate synthase [Pseudooceanicola sp. CBS1P-1]|uniref:Bifunctional enzyme IspD/IspF n=1 Tax=Pseudooceanicola albus TaxID=2692189 RepID=A0A6L7G180_9RHOB|nr:MULTISPECIES: bifunctional 2-C-methyl-D-erythritol 4-phosphate cytidylyltransferase/2-C-methyl-D-erythritol 2,4-cyclodiphosphate synthase [Pseudooceanicola]MBT9383845.1 bifunctional 2-C-methyl-D-erythritol 4-phosphate cytidylyltransferase/2-C-methyl-D-erythritol 2,4-cyclodiphosphate synthase [Pseudooceanicola endophyticus]MXN17699.1 bifunctional 2-C-methyl-D-erythritol 4-phosphate cytidylyltransferase/2-C-methyl-D-erythritol 2,4-cyclodiphosphate synthase [Pseudooceanicola albus]